MLFPCILIVRVLIKNLRLIIGLQENEEFKNNICDKYYEVNISCHLSVIVFLVNTL
jgi:hypothetical protein